MINNLGDIPVHEFRKRGHELIDWIADYLATNENYSVLSQVKPGEIKEKLPKHPPEDAESFLNIYDDVNNIIMPGITHWNHPGFMAYFNSTGLAPGILAEILTAGLSVNGMLWKSSPSATELEEVTVNWMKEMLGLPENFWGIIYDTASTSTMHAIAASREYASQFQFRSKGMSGRTDTKPLRLYASEHAHSSIAKGALTVGLGLEGIKYISTDENFSMKSGELRDAIEEDIKNGIYPLCVVSTVGTTSTTSIDPLPEIGEICKQHNIWLHVDAAHAGIAAILPEQKNIFRGMEYADSLVVNPHKWMGIPMDLSLFYTKRKDVLKQAFSLSAEYLKTEQDSEVENYMDYGIQLGRRFRSLKLWFTIRRFGVTGIQKRVRHNIELARQVKTWIEESEIFQLMAPVPFSTLCFRAEPNSIEEKYYNAFNERLMKNVNETGKIFLSHTVLNGKFVIRIVISSFRMSEYHIRTAWDTINETCISTLENFANE